MELLSARIKRRPTLETSRTATLEAFQLKVLSFDPYALYLSNVTGHFSLILPVLKINHSNGCYDLMNSCLMKK